jgi:hypothetical protein
MNGLLGQLAERLEKDLPVDVALQNSIAEEDAGLVKLHPGQIGTIPTNAPINGEFTHQLVLADPMGAVLEEAGAPSTGDRLAARTWVLPEVNSHSERSQWVESPALS